MHGYRTWNQSKDSEEKESMNCKYYFDFSRKCNRLMLEMGKIVTAMMGVVSELGWGLCGKSITVKKFDYESM